MSRNALPSPEQFSHCTDIKVRWGDMDSLGHVNNVVFFTFDEQARLEYFSQLNALVPNFWTQSGLILAKLGCDFLAQVHHPATVSVYFRISRIGKSSMETETLMCVAGRPVARGAGVVVWFDYVAQKTAPIPEQVKQFIRGIEPLAPLEA